MNDLGTQRGTCEDNEGYTEIQSILFNCALLHKFIISLTASDTICNLEIQKWNEITFCSTIWKHLECCESQRTLFALFYRPFWFR